MTPHAHTHGFTRDPYRWCQSSPWPFVERGADGEDRDQPAWFVRLPCALARNLRLVAKANGQTRERFLAELLRGALEKEIAEKAGVAS